MTEREQEKYEKLLTASHKLYKRYANKNHKIKNSSKYRKLSKKLNKVLNLNISQFITKAGIMLLILEDTITKYNPK